MIIYTLGFTQKSAQKFFETIKKHQIELLIDVRLNNNSQLASFTKGRDLPYFLKELCDCAYIHEVAFAPTKEILDNYKKDRISWEEYEISFNLLEEKRKVYEIFRKKYSSFDKVLLLCSEPQANNCHRRLVAEHIKEKLSDLNIEIRHLL